MTRDYRVSDGVVEEYRTTEAGWFPACPDDLIPVLFELVTQLQREVANLKQHRPFNPNLR